MPGSSSSTTSPPPDGDTDTTWCDTVDHALACIAGGQIVVVVDDESREDEGDLIMAAQFATDAALAFFVEHTSGLICASMPPDRCERLELPLMVPGPRNGESHATAFTVSVDARVGVATGISAADRALTARVLADPAATAHDLVRPGHLFPLRAREGGVLERRGHTEAGVDLCRLAGVQPVALLCEVVNRDGTMARRKELRAFAAGHHLPIITVGQLVSYRRQIELGVTRLADCRLPTDAGQFDMVLFRSNLDGADQIALVMGDPSSADAPLVRVHSECMTGDVFSSQRCDCGGQLASSLREVAAEGCGVVIYLRGHEGRGIGLANKLAAYGLQDGGLDTVDANLALGLPVDDRDYDVAAWMLRELGIDRLRLLTNNLHKIAALTAHGLAVVEQVPLPPTVTPANRRYLHTKRERMGHLLESVDSVSRSGIASSPEHVRRTNHTARDNDHVVRHANFGQHPDEAAKVVDDSADAAFQ